MRSDRVVVLAPLLDEDGGLLQAVEDLTVQAFVAQFAVEALAVAVLPRTSRLDVGRLGSDGGNPFSKSNGDDLGAVIRPKGCRDTPVLHRMQSSFHSLAMGKQQS